MIVYKVEYYEPTTDKWISIYETTNQVEAHKRISLLSDNTTVKRIAEYRKVSVSSVTYTYLRDIMKTKIVP